ncbi:hypothetical protein C5E01_02020 [Rathayibacter iranicus]|nr:hypothetical protein C5E01_02020 [Rathayibacter iranicus]
MYYSRLAPVVLLLSDATIEIREGSMTTRKVALMRRIAIVSGPLALGAFLLSGCSDAPSEEVTSETTTLAEAASTADQYEQKRLDYQDKISACLSKRGVSSLNGATLPDGSDEQETTPANREAESACTDEVGEEPAPTAEETAALRTWNNSLFSCLSDKGHTMPALQANGEWNETAMTELLKTDDTLDSDTDACMTDLSG